MNPRISQNPQNHRVVKMWNFQRQASFFLTKDTSHDILRKLRLLAETPVQGTTACAVAYIYIYIMYFIYIYVNVVVVAYVAYAFIILHFYPMTNMMLNLHMVCSSTLFKQTALKWMIHVFLPTLPPSPEENNS